MEPLINKNMKEQLHSNFIKSSNLIFATVGMGIINFFFSGVTLSNGANIVTAIFTLLFICGVGIIVRQGYAWVKYLLLVLTTLGLILIAFIPGNPTQNSVVTVVNIAQTVLQVWATILLFRVPKITESRLVE